MLSIKVLLSLSTYRTHLIIFNSRCQFFWCSLAKLFHFCFRPDFAGCFCTSASTGFNSSRSFRCVTCNASSGSGSIRLSLGVLTHIFRLWVSPYSTLLKSLYIYIYIHTSTTLFIPYYIRIFTLGNCWCGVRLCGSCRKRLNINNIYCTIYWWLPIR